MGISEAGTREREMEPWPRGSGCLALPAPAQLSHWETVVWRASTDGQSVFCFLEAIEFHLTTWGLFGCEIYFKMFTTEGYYED